MFPFLSTIIHNATHRRLVVSHLFSYHLRMKISHFFFQQVDKLAKNKSNDIFEIQFLCIKHVFDLKNVTA